MVRAYNPNRPMDSLTGGEDTNNTAPTGISPAYADSGVSLLLITYGRRLLLTAYLLASHNDVAAQNLIMAYRVDSGAWIDFFQTEALQNVPAGLSGSILLPGADCSSGSHTYEIGAVSSAGTITIHGDVLVSRVTVTQ